ncbi:MAG: 50S ribosomal protein L22 [Candidatus Kerfeldbacteria bacterium]|nr:50S ribosomal protein L22 [Candidatus Kerfeldbacteria bacterium]
MEVRAHLRHLRTAPRKVRLVINLIRGLSVEAATDQLHVLPKGSSLPVLKLLQSAVANADHNFHLDTKTLKVKSIVANEGPKLKRYRPRAFGRAAEILKRSTHITLVLEGTALTKSVKKVTPPPADKVTAADIKGQPAEAKPAMKPAADKRSATETEQVHQAQDANVHRKGLH